MTTAAGADLLDPALLHHVVNTLGWPSLRPLQSDAITPAMRGDDLLMVAPTAGGKTEAAVFPLLSAMTAQRWTGLSVLYVCPLRALLNNLEPRLQQYSGWVGRRAALWHGDTGDTARRRLLIEPPDILLTTPESLEAMLVSTRVTPREHFAKLRAVVVDELHAFAGDDRGWHLLSVLERLQHLAGRPIQRIGLSATVGNPDALVRWLQGSGRNDRAATVLKPEPAPVALDAGVATAADVTLDYVGSTDNAATVISSLHRGEKRLVFCESRRQVEELAFALRERDVETYVSHSSLSLDERRRSETAFSDARDCVIVSTSTLELGIDVGDLDRMIQLDSPRTVASFLQRIGRTGRRIGTTRNALFLATRGSALVQAAGLLRLWAQGWVEPVTPPPSPRHLIAQQILALCLQELRVGDQMWPRWWAGFDAWTDEDARTVVSWLVDTGHLDSDAGMLFLGPEAERRYGQRHFMELVSIVTAEPEFTVFAGREELGRIDPLVLLRKVEGPRHISLAGRAWLVGHIDWRRHRCWVEPAAQGAKMRWTSQAQPLSFELCQSRRAVLLGESPPVRLSKRALSALDDERTKCAGQVRPDHTVIDEDKYWWTFAGARANATLMAALPNLFVPDGVLDNDGLQLRNDLAPGALRAAIVDFNDELTPIPFVSDEALEGLKFAESLPPDLARRTLAERLLDLEGMRATLAGSRRVVHGE